MPSADNKRVAKNAIALTLRMVLATIVGLYTSRIVLQALGVDDYGIYGVIGGVVGMASFLNTSMAGATSRFITFELGRGNETKLKRIFSTALIIHIAIAVFVAILAETVGLWFVNSKMNFPPDRMFAVNVLYQFTILSMFIGFTQVPYSAAIIAHEKMNIYAYFEILNVVLKLAIVYLLLIVSTDRLILYAALTLAVGILSALIYRYYCIHHFKETRFAFVRDRALMKEMLTFSGYDLFGNMCAVAKNQGQPIILNMFFGVVANAAASIALTVTGAIGALTTTIAQAFKPQIIKQYSIDNIDGMGVLMGRSIQFTLLAYTMVALPVVFETPRILYIWLGQIPPYSCDFLRLIVIASLFEAMINLNNIGIHSTGDIRRISFISGTFYLLTPVASYLVIRFLHTPATTIYIVGIALSVIVTFLGWRFIKIQIPQFRIRPFLAKLCRVWFCLIAAAIIVYFGCKADGGWNFRPDESILASLIAIAKSCIISVVAICALAFAFSLNRYERELILRKFKLRHA